MYAITIWPLYAALEIAGAKPAELRKFKPWPRLIGQHIAIHAGVRKMRVPEILEVLDNPRAICSALATETQLNLARDIADKAMRDPDSLVYGAVLGTSVIGEPQPDARYGWAWPLSDVERFTKPVPAVGKQGFWKWEPIAAE